MTVDDEARDSQGLTRREQEILRLAREGLSNNEIAKHLGLKHNAVRFHLKNLHAKLLTDGQRAALAGNARAGRRWGWLPFAFSGWVGATAGTVAVVAVSIGGYVGVRVANESHQGNVAATDTSPAAIATMVLPATDPTLAGIAQRCHLDLGTLRQLNPGIKEPLTWSEAILVPVNDHCQAGEAVASPRPTASTTVSPWGPYPIPQSTIDSLTAYRDQVLSNPPPIDPALLQRMLTGQLDDVARGTLSEFQRNILADGYITLDEYTSAKTAWRNCMVAQGFDVPPLHLGGTGRYDQTFSGPDRATMDASNLDCAAQYTGTLDLAWPAVVAPIETKVGAVQSNAVVACLQMAGYSGTPPATGSDSNPGEDEAYGKCVQEIQKATDTGSLWLGP